MNDRTRRIWGAFLLFAIAVCVYWPCLGLGFIFDDSDYLLKNDALKSATAWHDIWLTTRLINYYPVFFSFLRLQWEAWGTDPRGYHLVNILVHAANAALLYLVLARWRLKAAWVAALLFAIHPLNVQTVAWISEQKNTVSLFFLLLAALALLVEKEISWRRFLGGFVLFAAALLSKPSVILFPVFMIGLWFWQGKLRGTKAKLQMAALCAASIAASAATIWFENHRVAVGEPLAKLPMAERFGLVGAALGFYFKQALLPIRLALFYPGWSPEEQAGLSFLADTAVLCIFAALLLLAWRKKMRPLFLAAVFYYAIMMLPFLGLANTNFFRWSIIADHWQYHALPGAMVLLAELIAAAADRLRPYAALSRAALSAGCAGWFMTISWAQMPNFKDDISLSEYGIERNPRAWLSWYNLGTHLSPGDRPGAVAALRKATEIAPDYFDARFNLANELLHAKAFAEAEDSYRKAIALKPETWDAYGNLAVVYLNLNRTREAEEAFREALRINPTAQSPLQNLTLLYIRSGRYREAARLLPELWKIAPGDPVILSALNEAAAKEKPPSADLAVLMEMANMQP